MSNILKYKGYHTKIEFDSETYVLRGKIEGINDFIDFESSDLNAIEKEFHEAVDDYLEFCKEIGKQPEKEYKGTFNVRIAPTLHKQLAIEAMKKDTSLNTIVERAITQYLANEHNTPVKLENSIKILAEVLKTESIYQYTNQSIQSAEMTFPFLENNLNMTYKI